MNCSTELGVKSGDKFVLEALLYDETNGKEIEQFLENVKTIVHQNEMLSAVEFPSDHPLEKAVRATLAATVKHLDLGELKLLI